MPCFEKFLEIAENTLKNCEQQFSEISWAAGEDNMRRPADERNRNLARALCRDLVLVMESITYFLAYRKGNFKETADVRDFDKKFTKLVDVDYFPRNDKYETTREYTDHEMQFPLSNSTQKFLKDQKYLYGIRNRQFWEIESSLRNNTNVLPSLKGIPFFEIKPNNQFDGVKKDTVGFVENIILKLSDLFCHGKEDMQCPVDEENMSWKEIPIDDDSRWRKIDSRLDQDHMHVMLNICQDLFKSISMDCLK
ncbi:hypothetical protein SAMN05720764_10812 [Fibrobacter sp. UWH5]|nr:hypothetical protein SAMN05720764_10812 [Fibrobacter sp. UWH5]